MLIKESFENNKKTLSNIIPELTEFVIKYDGDYSSVYKSKMDDKDVIVKFSTNEDRIYIAREIDILSIINHDNIIKIINYSINDDICILVTEYIYDKDLLDYFNECRDLKLHSDYITTQLIEAVNYLHTNNISHGDIKPENVIYNPINNKITLIDFGFAKKHSQRLTFVNEKKGTRVYAAPEIFKTTLFDPFKADIYSLGVVFHLCIKNKLPRKKISKCCPIVVKKMLYKNPYFRPDIENIKKNIEMLLVIKSDK